MCPNLTNKAANLAKKAVWFIRDMVFCTKKEAPAAFDFLSPPKEEKRAENGKVCPAV